MIRVTITITDQPGDAVAIQARPDLRSLLDLDQHGQHTTSAIRYAIAAWAGMRQVARMAGGDLALSPAMLAALQPYESQVISSNRGPYTTSDLTAYGQACRDAERSRWQQLIRDRATLLMTEAAEQRSIAKDIRADALIELLYAAESADAATAAPNPPGPHALTLPSCPP